MQHDARFGRLSTLFKPRNVKAKQNNVFHILLSKSQKKPKLNEKRYAERKKFNWKHKIPQHFQESLNEHCAENMLYVEISWNTLTELKYEIDKKIQYIVLVGQKPTEQLLLTPIPDSAFCQSLGMTTGHAKSESDQSYSHTPLPGSDDEWSGQAKNNFFELPFGTMFWLLSRMANAHKAIESKYQSLHSTSFLCAPEGKVELWWKAPRGTTPIKLLHPNQRSSWIFFHFSFLKIFSQTPLQKANWQQICERHNLDHSSWENMLQVIASSLTPPQKPSESGEDCCLKIFKIVCVSCCKCRRCLSAMWHNYLRSNSHGGMGGRGNISTILKTGPFSGFPGQCFVWIAVLCQNKSLKNNFGLFRNVMECQKIENKNCEVKNMQKNFHMQYTSSVFNFGSWFKAV